MKDNKTAVYALTASGAELGLRLKHSLGADFYVLDRYSPEDSIPFKRLSDIVADKFSEYSSHIFISACGIVVRQIAPLLVSKLTDPAVVVVDQAGKFAISLVSGHLGGANRLACSVAEIIGGQAVITTATDVCSLPSIDILARESHLYAYNPNAFKYVNSGVLDNQIIKLYDRHNILKLPESLNVVKIDSPDSFTSADIGVYIGVQRLELHEKILQLHPENLLVGVGCRRGTSAEEIMDLLNRVFNSEELDMKFIRSIASIDVKKDEQGLLEAADNLNVETLFYSAEELEGLSIESPSEFVFNTVGVHGVCEAAALKGISGRLIVGKRKNAKATMAVAVEC